jgi:hypothetical protein
MHFSRIWILVVVVGLRSREFERLKQRANELNMPVDIHDGGHIGDGSNCAQRASWASRHADVVLWNKRGSRKLSSGFRKNHVVRRVTGVTSALRALEELIRHLSDDE